MRHLRTQNPARAVAISGAVIVTLIVLAVGSSVLRFDRAQESYDRVAVESSQNLAVVGALRQNILDRQTAVITYYGEGDAGQLAQLPRLERQFDARVVNAQRIHETAGSTVQRLAEMRRLNATITRLRNELIAAAKPRPDLGEVNAAIAKLELAITGYSNAEGRELSGLVATAADQADAARHFAVIAGLIAALLTTAMVLYITRVLRHLLRRVRRSASTLTDAVADMRKAAQESAAALAEQSAAVAEVAATADELSSTASAIAAGAETMSSAAEETAATVDDMREQAATIAQRSLELGRSSEEIGEILTLLTDIAERTDLLALNAAIEAAHAGDAGRGFAVVATEIRKLAESSGRSTKSIQDVVARVQDTSGATILAAERGTAQSDEIADRMLRSTADLEDSRQAAEQQRAAAEQVAGALSGIRGAVQKLSTEEVARVATTQQVEDLTGDLTKLLEAHGITLNGNGAAKTAA